MKILIVLPAHNEEKIIKANCQQLLAFCQQNLTDDWQVVVADNASIDRTGLIAKELAVTEPGLAYLLIKQKGKGLAVKTVWLNFLADIYIFMDADLAVDLKALPKLVEAVKEGDDIAIGSRRLPGSKVEREIEKKLVSWAYNQLAKMLLKSKIADHACGFKAVNQRIIREILPLVQDDQWFFDTELLILAEQNSYKTKEIPVEWAEHKTKGRKSKVRFWPLAFAYLREMRQLRKRLKI